MAERATKWIIHVQCLTNTCPDHEVTRTITLPHLGDGVFLCPTGTSILGLEMLNLLCGTCRGRMFFEVPPPKADTSEAP